jgi:hypothetical protein
LFDSQCLETQQLTEYVDILRMMGCARDVIIEKFLAAHKYRLINHFIPFLILVRSLRMMKNFRQQIDTAILSRNSMPLHLNTESSSLSVSNIRTFHQNIMVGLIEASKGIRDMFQENRSYKVFIPIEQNGEGFTMSLANAYDELQGMLGIVIPEYTQCILKPLREFFSHYDRIMLLKETGHLDSLPNESHENGSTTNPLVNIVPLLEEERTIWIALTRQIILDCQYLDSGTEACRPAEYDASLPHADGVAESILSTLDQHFDHLYEKKIKILQDALLKSIPEFINWSDCLTVWNFSILFYLEHRN